MVNTLKLNERSLILGFEMEVNICMTFKTKEQALNFEEY